MATYVVQSRPSLQSCTSDCDEMGEMEAGGITRSTLLLPWSPNGRILKYAKKKTLAHNLPLGSFASSQWHLSWLTSETRPGVEPPLSRLTKPSRPRVCGHGAQAAEIATSARPWHTQQAETGSGGVRNWACGGAKHSSRHTCLANTRENIHLLVYPSIYIYTNWRLEALHVNPRRVKNYKFLR